MSRSTGHVDPLTLATVAALVPQLDSGALITVAGYWSAMATHYDWARPFLAVIHAEQATRATLAAKVQP